MYSRCIICGSGNLKEILLNNLEMKQCLGCGLIWRKNFDLPSKYYQNYKYKISDNKIKERLSNSLERIRTFRKYIDLNNLCDFGTGEGIFLKALKMFGYDNVIGIEPNIKARQYAEANNLKVYNIGIEKIGDVIKDDNIHVVSLLHVIEHLKNPVQYLKIIYDSLRKGDKIVIETPNINAYSFRKLKYKHKLIYPEHLFYFNEENLKLLLKQIGFKVVIMGKRDFNQSNLSIRESLFRLGLIKIKTSEINNLSIKTKKESITSVNVGCRFKFLRNFIRKILILAVNKLGRQEYIWTIAKK